MTASTAQPGAENYAMGKLASGIPTVTVEVGDVCMGSGPKEHPEGFYDLGPRDVHPWHKPAMPSHEDIKSSPHYPVVVTANPMAGSQVRSRWWGVPPGAGWWLGMRLPLAWYQQAHGVHEARHAAITSRKPLSTPACLFLLLLTIPPLPRPVTPAP